MRNSWSLMWSILTYWTSSKCQTLCGNIWMMSTRFHPQEDTWYCYFHPALNAACCCSVPKSCPTLWPHRLQHARLLCISLFPRVCSNSCPLSQWYYLTISSSAAPFSFCLQSFPASGSVPMSQLFASGIVDSHCFNFFCTAKWFSYIFIFIFFPLWFTTGYWIYQ